jgi:CheY-like chemotaxis protein
MREDKTMAKSASKRILIVDDNPNMSVLLSDILEIFEYEGNRASDGNEALEKLKTDDYAMVFTDLRMPKMDGIDLLRAIKDARPDLPVVVITGYSIGETQNLLVSQKADGFLNKPFKVNEIKDLLEKLLGFQG